MKRYIPITLRPNVLLDTGRTSYRDVIQLLPKAGGIRECIVARPGYVFCSCDYNMLELVAHAQSCLWIAGYSKLAEAINSGIKVHDKLGAEIVGKPYDQFVELVKAGDKYSISIRSSAKPGNFGFPGGMGELKLVHQQRQQGPDTTTSEGRVYKGLRFCALLGEKECGRIKIQEYKRKPTPPTCAACVEIAAGIRQNWFNAWPENKDVFSFVSDCVENGQLLPNGSRLKPGQIRQHLSHRLRGGLSFCQAANSFFQGLAADGAKLALTRVTQECYDQTLRLSNGDRSPLFGSRPILFAHDEIIAEMPEEKAHAAAHRLSEVMVAAMREKTPDVKVEAPPALMRRWIKAAAPVYSDGVLVPWDDKEKYAT